MKKLLILLLCSGILSSCSSGGADDGLFDKGDSAAKLPKCADYGTGDVIYTAEVSDGKRSVTLKAERKGGISVAAITLPEELSGTVITDDVEGMRIITGDGCELPVSAEMSKGLETIFAAYLPFPEDAKAVGSKAVEFLSDGYTVRLSLTEDGYPDTASITKNGVTRHVKFTRLDGN